MMVADVFARDEVLDARAFSLQRAFRAMLDAMARPGEIHELPAASRTAADDARAAGLLPATVVVADVLLDAATSVACAGESGPAAERLLARRAHARIEHAPRAAYAIVPAGCGEGQTRAFIASLFPGTLESPHLGATCIVECGSMLGVDEAGARTGSVSGSHETSSWELSGPGNAAVARFECDRADALSARVERADEFPCGIDLLLVDGAGHIMAVPRSNELRPAKGPEEGGRTWDM